MTDTTYQDFDKPAAPPAPPASDRPTTSPIGRPRYAVWSRLFGVVLPTFVLVLEVLTGFCAEHFFDPVSTLWHVLLVATVPVATFFAIRTLVTARAPRPRLLGIGAGFALAVAVYYAVLYLPLMVPSVYALILLGMGLLSLAPFFSMVALTSVMWRVAEKGDLGAHARRLFVGGFLLGTVALLALEGPRYATRLAISMASSTDAATQERGLALLRTVGSEKTVLRACYEPRSGWGVGGMDSSGWLMSYFDNSTGTTDARRAYYRMTGESFNTAPAPDVRSRFAEDGWTRTVIDDDRGGALVGGRVPELELVSSRIDSHLDPVSALSYTEWTMVFENSADMAAEARLGVAIPPDAAVSRLTLWINGEPHEAAFGTKSQTRGAYESVVRRQLDPVLVTQSVPGRVLVQCFPVPARDEMKIRFGVTAPLDAEGRCWLPAMVERNFDVGRRFEHDVWAQTAAAELTSGLESTRDAQPRGGGRGLEAAVSGETLLAGAWFSAGKADPLATVHAVDRLGDADAPRVLVRRGSMSARQTPGHVVAVVDTSASMRPHWSALKDSIDLLSQNAQVTLVLASDLIEQVSGEPGIAAALGRTRPVGGIDNSPALLRALEIAGGAGEATPVLWIHGAQPELLAKRSEIERALERRLARRPIYSLQVGEGADRVSEVFAAAGADLRAAPFGRDMAERVGLLFAGGERVRYQFEHLPAGAAAPEGSVEVWDHVVRSWALGQVTSALQADTGAGSAELANRAARYQLVTPVSGAVVLEQQSQFDAAGLDQLDASETPSVPVIPEPSTGALTILAGALFALRRRR